MGWQTSGLMHLTIVKYWIGSEPESFSARFAFASSGILLAGSMRDMQDPDNE